MRSRSSIKAATTYLMLVAAIGVATPGQWVLSTAAVAAPNAGPNPGTISVGDCKQNLAFGGISTNQLGVCIGTSATGYVYYLKGADTGGAIAEACNYWLSVFPDYFYSQWDNYTECLNDGAGLYPTR